MAEPERSGDEGNAERECTSPTFHIDILDFVFENSKVSQEFGGTPAGVGRVRTLKPCPRPCQTPNPRIPEAASATLPPIKEQATAEDGLLLTNGTGNYNPTTRLCEKEFKEIADTGK